MEKKYGVFFGNWEGTEDEPEFIGSYDECDEYYDYHYDMISWEMDEYYEIKEL